MYVYLCILIYIIYKQYVPHVCGTWYAYRHVCIHVVHVHMNVPSKVAHVCRCMYTCVRIVHVLYVWDEQKLLKSINTKYQVLRKIGKNSELEKFSSL